MFSDRVKKVVGKARPTQTVALILRVAVKPDRSEVAAIADASKRRLYVDRFYSKAKRPVVNGVKSLTGVEIIDSLEGTNQMVVAAPAGVWRRYLAHPPALFQRRDLTVTPNEIEITL